MLCLVSCGGFGAHGGESGLPWLFARICDSTSMCLSQQNMLSGGTALLREGEIPEFLTDLLIVTKRTVNSLSLFETFVSVHL